MRPPLVAGLDHGVGTSTVALALHARDGGRCGGAADIVVCGSDAGSLQRAATVGTGATTLLAVAGGTASVPRSRVRNLETRFAVVVVLPHVGRWNGLLGPPDEALTLLGQPVDHLPRPLRSYAAALRVLATAVLRSGLLDHSAPPPFSLPGPTVPPMARPRIVESGCGRPPLARRVDVSPVLRTAPRAVRPTLIATHRPLLLPVTTVPPPAGPALPDVDDDALEAAALAIAAGRAG